MYTLPFKKKKKSIPTHLFQPPKQFYTKEVTHFEPEWLDAFIVPQAYVKKGLLIRIVEALRSQEEQ